MSWEEPLVPRSRPLDAQPSAVPWDLTGVARQPSRLSLGKPAATGENGIAVFSAKSCE